MSIPFGSTGKFRLFVYGTLKRGGIRHGPLRSQHFLRETKTAPRYALHDLGDYPGLVHCPEEGMAVYGELYEVDCSLKEWLDATEGAPNWFNLEPIELDPHDGPTWAYFFQGKADDKPRIVSGRWEIQP